MQRHFHSRNYRYVGAEFGTHSMIRVLAALRSENRAHFYSAESSPAYRRAKSELLECFCPTSLEWRHSVVESGLKIIEQGSRALSQLATTMPAGYQD
jgi:hypothetical protein